MNKKTANCVGWKSILRCIQVIDMGFIDLIQKIIPTKVVIKELKSLSGKVLSSDSHYVLTEEKRTVSEGKKTSTVTKFALTLQDDEEKMKIRREKQAAEE